MKWGVGERGRDGASSFLLPPDHAPSQPGHKPSEKGAECPHSGDFKPGPGPENQPVEASGQALFLQVSNLACSEFSSQWIPPASPSFSLCLCALAPDHPSTSAPTCQISLLSLPPHSCGRHLLNEAESQQKQSHHSAWLCPLGWLPGIGVHPAALHLWKKP